MKQKPLRPALRLMIGDKEYRAIGHTSAQWALFETQLDFVLMVLTQQPSTQNLWKNIPQSFKKRLDILRRAAKVALVNDPAPLSELLEIVSAASSLRGLRDDIVHGQWKIHRAHPRAATTTGVLVYSRGSPVKRREVAFSAERVESIAAQISHACLRLFEWIHKYVPAS